MRNPISILLTMLRRLRRTKEEPAEPVSLLYANDRLRSSSQIVHTPKQHESIW